MRADGILTIEPKPSLDSEPPSPVAPGSAAGFFICRRHQVKMPHLLLPLSEMDRLSRPLFFTAIGIPPCILATAIKSLRSR
jgi:hypothetical protein